MPRIQDHLDLSKNVMCCKGCKSLYMIRYLGNTLCDRCEKNYRKVLNKILF